MKANRFGITRRAFLEPFPRRPWRGLLFIALFAVTIAVVSPIGVRIGAYFGTLIDAQILDAKSPAFALLYKARLSNSMTWNEDLGVVAANLPQLMAFLMLSAAFVLLLGCFYRRPLRSWFTAAGQFRWRLFWSGLVLYGIIYAAGLALQGHLTPTGYKPGLGWLNERPLEIAIFLLSMLIIISFKAAAEELLCRGWLQKELVSYIPNVFVVVIVSSGVFALLHPEKDLRLLLVRFVSGSALGWAAVRTNGLEFSAGLHSAWNLALLLLGQDHSVRIQPRMPLPQSIPISVAEWTVPIALPLIAILLVELVARWRPARKMLRVDYPAADATSR